MAIIGQKSTSFLTGLLQGVGNVNQMQYAQQQAEAEARQKAIGELRKQFFSTTEDIVSGKRTRNRLSELDSQISYITDFANNTGGQLPPGYSMDRIQGLYKEKSNLMTNPTTAFTQGEFDMWAASPLANDPYVSPILEQMRPMYQGGVGQSGIPLESEQDVASLATTGQFAPQTHMMPDGTVMPGATHGGLPPAFGAGAQGFEQGAYSGGQPTVGQAAQQQIGRPAQSAPELVAQGAQRAKTQSILNAASPFMGQVYKWGGESVEEGGFDCSGLAYKAMRNAGVDVPRTTAANYANMFDAVGVNDLQPGDLMYFDTKGKGKVTHMGIYAGDGKMIHASAKNKKVIRADINNSYWENRFVKANRPPAAGQGATPFLSDQYLQQPNVPLDFGGGTPASGGSQQLDPYGIINMEQNELTLLEQQLAELKAAPFKTAKINKDIQTLERQVSSQKTKVQSEIARAKKDFDTEQRSRRSFEREEIRFQERNESKSDKTKEEKKKEKVITSYNSLVTPAGVPVYGIKSGKGFNGTELTHYDTPLTVFQNLIDLDVIDDTDPYYPKFQQLVKNLDIWYIPLVRDIIEKRKSLIKNALMEGKTPPTFKKLPKNILAAMGNPYDWHQNQKNGKSTKDSSGNGEGNL